MNNLTRVLLVFISAALCAEGVIWHGHCGSSDPAAAADSFIGTEFVSFEFASADRHKFSFVQLEEIVRADAGTRFPNARVELGSVKAERGRLTMNVVLFGPNHEAQAFLYTMLPEKNSWKIASAHRLWFVPSTQIARGLRV